MSGICRDSGRICRFLQMRGNRLIAGMTFHTKERRRMGETPPFNGRK